MIDLRAVATAGLTSCMYSRRAGARIRARLTSRFADAEWQAALTRPEHLPLGANAQLALQFARNLASIAHLQDVHFLWRPFLRDPDDDMVLECAVASGAGTIVTHNVKDFARADSLGVQARTPGQFLNNLKEK